MMDSDGKARLVHVQTNTINTNACVGRRSNKCWANEAHDKQASNAQLDRTKHESEASEANKLYNRKAHTPMQATIQSAAQRYQA